MKRNVISLLLAVVMVFAITAVVTLTAEPVAAATGHTNHCWCEGASVAPAGHEGCAATQEWTGIQANNSNTLSSGYYYLAAFNAGAIKVGDGANVYLCLNGIEVRSNQPIQFLGENSSLTICDCSEGQTGYVNFTTIGATAANVKLAKATNSCTLVSGSLTTGCNTAAASTTRYAVNVSAGTFNMYGGTICDLHSNASTDRSGAPANELVQVSGGTFNLYGGLITGGNNPSNYGGNVYVKGGNFTMSGGSITEGKATGSSKHGGNVWLSTGTFTMSGGNISGGSATAKGGNVVMTGGTFNMSNGTISGGQAGTLGGNVSLNTAATFNMTGGTITGGWSTTTSATEGGGNVHVHGTSSSFNMSNGTITNGGSYTTADGTAAVMGYGGNIYVQSGTLNIGTQDGTGNPTISNGQAANQGGNILATGADAVINHYSGTVSGGSAANGGSIRIDKNSSYTLDGGSVTGGNATTGNGGNFSITGNAVFTMTRGSVSGGQAKSGSGNGANLFLAGACNVTVTGGEVGAYTNAASGVYLNHNNAVFTVGGTAKVTDVALGTTGYKIAISDETPLASGAAISVNAPEGTVIADTTTDHSAYFTSYVSGYDVAHNTEGTGLVIVVAGHSAHCWCVDSETVDHANCESAEWTAVESGVVTFTANNQRIYLTGQCSRVDIGTEENPITEGTFYLCLNGNNLRAQTPINITSDVTLYVCNCQDGGVIKGSSTNNRLIALTAGSLTMVNVTVDGENSNKPLDLRGSSTTELYDCDLLNGKRTGSATAQGYGDSVYMEGTAQLDAVNCKFQLASDTTAKGNIYADDGTTLTLTDCTVSGGTDLFLVHGNLTLDGTTTLTGATNRHIVLYQKADALTLGSSFAPAGDQVWDVIKAAPADATEAEKYAFATGASDSNKDLFRAVGEGGDYITSYEAETVYLIPSACRIDDVGYASLAEALEDYDPAGQAIKLNDDCNETSLTLTKNVVIDLNGHNITKAITSGDFNLSIYDYANYQYDADACGSYAGDNAEKYVVVDETMSGATTLRRYIALENEDGTWSFHRVYVTISAVSINPTADVTSLNYSTVFIGDEAVADYINSNNGEYGLKAVIDGYEAVERPYTDDFKACTTDLVNNTTYFTEKQTAISNIMKSDAVDPSDLSDLNNSQRAAKEVKATAYIKLTIDGEEITVESSNQAATARSFQGMVNTAAAAWDSLLPAQKTALWSLKETFGSELTTDNGWVVDKIVDPEETV